MTTNHGTSRRSVLGAAFAAVGVAGTGLAAKLGHAADSDSATEQDPDPPTVPTLFLDRYALHVGASGRGSQRAKGDQTLLRGTLVDASGTRVGEVFASAVTMPGAADVESRGTSRMEVQHLELADGAIVATGIAFAHSDVPNVYTVVGGSGRYVGVRGSYTFDHDPTVTRPVGTASITFDLDAPTAPRRPA